MLDFLRNLDRRWIFLAMLLAVAVPILCRQRFPEKTTRLAQAVFDKVEDLPDRSIVLIGIDYDPSTTGELGPMTTAFIRHCCLKRHKMIFLTLFETGPPVVDEAIRDIVENEFASANFEDGVDYVNLGYRPGKEVVISGAVLNLKKSIETDSSGKSLTEMELTRNITNLKDVDLIFDISAGFPGWKEWVQYAASPHRIPMAAGVTAVGAPQAYPYLPNQILGLLAAIKGAAEYEVALGKKYPQYRNPKKSDGLRRMAPQFWAHLLIIGLILLGNGIYFADRWRGGRR